MKNRWYSIFNLKGHYDGPEKEFVNTENFEWAKEFQRHFEEIKNEFYQFLNSKDLSPYFNTSMVKSDNDWRTIALKSWSVELYKNQVSFPFTTKLINKYPEIISASFNLLEPKSIIKPHVGDTNAIYRCHLGLTVPEGLPSCGFEVRGQQRPWVENEWIIFLDAFEHTAFNQTNNPRVILLLDVLRDEFTSNRREVTSTVLTSLFLQKREMKFRMLNKENQSFVSFLVIVLRPFAFIALKFSNFFKLF